jgi:signal transduction histidine kinase
MDEPMIYSLSAARLPAAEQLDLRSILQAWNEATERLQRTHEALQHEVRRLSDELEAKNRELARSRRLADLGQMASHVAHEVRNSLVPMKLYLTLLRRQARDDAASEGILDKILAGFAALEATVGDLLHFSGQRDPQWTTFDLRELMDEVCDALEPQLKAQEIAVCIDCLHDEWMRADREMLRRGLLNLVLNAVDAMPRGGELSLVACRTSAGLEIEVADSGPGVSPRIADHLFEPFFTTKSSGTGLGLAIVERIAQAHGGRATVANCPEGGAAFTLIIPQFAQLQEQAA